MPEKTFTGKEQDVNTGLDYFGARYFSAVQGRFTSPDEFKGGIVDPVTGSDIETNGAIPYADITDPQTLNKYAYVRNNPLRFIDPDGHEIYGRGPAGEVELPNLDSLIRTAVHAYQATTEFLHNHPKLEVALAVGAQIGVAIVTEGESAEGFPEDPEMLGRKGVQTTSVTVGKDIESTGIRVDVENPDPGGRPGQIQIQRGTGTGKDTLLYDPATGDTSRPDGVKPSESNRISNTDLKKLQKSRDFKRAIEKAKKILGEQ